MAHASWARKVFPSLAPGGRQQALVGHCVRQQRIACCMCTCSQALQHSLNAMLSELEESKDEVGPMEAVDIETGIYSSCLFEVIRQVRKTPTISFITGIG